MTGHENGTTAGELREPWEAIRPALLAVMAITDLVETPLRDVNGFVATLCGLSEPRAVMSTKAHLRARGELVTRPEDGVLTVNQNMRETLQTAYADPVSLPGATVGRQALVELVERQLDIDSQQQDHMARIAAVGQGLPLADEALV